MAIKGKITEKKGQQKKKKQLLLFKKKMFKSQIVLPDGIHAIDGGTGSRVSVSVLKEGSMSSVIGHNLLLRCLRFQLRYVPRDPTKAATGQPETLQSICERVRGGNFDVLSLHVDGSIQTNPRGHHHTMKVKQMSEADDYAIVTQINDANILASKKHPMLFFGVDSKLGTSAPDGSQFQIGLNGHLTMKGLTRPIFCSAGLFRAPSGELDFLPTDVVREHDHVLFQCPVKLADWGVSNASMLMGVVRTCPTVNVEVDVPIQALK